MPTPMPTPITTSEKSEHDFSTVLLLIKRTADSGITKSIAAEHAEKVEGGFRNLPVLESPEE